jgi:GMP synthase (glutamine-hydrolysing)
MRVVAVVNQDDAGAGLFGEVIRASDAELVEWRPPSGEPPPADADAVVVLGGAMHPNQDADHPWLPLERAWLGELLESEVPTVGICLGAELLGHAAGGELIRLPLAEIGWTDVELSAEAASDPLLGALPPRFPSLQWHSFAVEPPPASAVLARSAACAQAYRLGERAWGIQFHAEVTPEIVAGWIADAEATDADDVREAGVDLGELRERTAREIASWTELGRGLCERFLALAADQRLPLQ